MMDKLTKLFLIIILIASAMISACGVTETGNPPLPQGEEEGMTPADPGPEVSNYQNDICGYSLVYDSDWIYEELSSSATVFTDNRTEATTATFSCYTLNPEPASLLDYLEATYPSRTFVEYDTTNLEGYEYDDPTEGTSGGDQREYYFLNGDILLVITAEVFTDAELEFEDLLDGIAFD